MRKGLNKLVLEVALLLSIVIGPNVSSGRYEFETQQDGIIKFDTWTGRTYVYFAEKTRSSDGITNRSNRTGRISQKIQKNEVERTALSTKRALKLSRK